MAKDDELDQKKSKGAQEPVGAADNENGNDVVDDAKMVMSHNNEETGVVVDGIEQKPWKALWKVISLGIPCLLLLIVLCQMCGMV